MQSDTIKRARRGTVLLLLFASAILMPRHSSAQSAFLIEGAWIGTLDVPGQKLRVVFNIEREADTAYTATLDSPDQGVKGIPVRSVRWNGTSLELDVPTVMGRYSGTRRTDTSIAGTWEQGGLSLPLTVTRAAHPVEIRRPQSPVRPFPYDELQVTIPTDDEGVTLSGTLTMPAGTGSAPCVILISGSGPQDRDETLFNHRPFLVIADYLTRRGIAVLRYDDRGIALSTGSFADATTVDFVQDALAALRFLRTQPRIDPAKIGLMGHSEGGIVAPMAAVESRDAAFVVLLAGTGLVGERILLLQQEKMLRAGGSTSDEIARNTAFQTELYGILKAESDTAAAVVKMKEATRRYLASYPDSVRGSANLSEPMIDRQVRQMISPWFRAFLTLDPAVALRRLRCPVLAINGEKDLQVPWEENLTAIAAALHEAGNGDVTTKKLPGLNHLFQRAVTGLPAEYGVIEETMAPEALETIGEWITSKTRE